MAADDASPPPISFITTCLIQHSFDLDEALSLPTDIARQVAESNSLVDRMPSDGGDHLCPICREGGGGGGKKAPCGHVYHAACISSWLSNSVGGSCPLCRRNIAAGHDEQN